MNKLFIKTLTVNKLRILNGANDDTGGGSIDDANWRSHILEKLESFDETKTIAEQGLPAVGDTSELTCKYMIGPDEWVDFTWQVLGYNGSIPKYVKYKNENNSDIRYVSSVDETTGILKTNYNNSKTYVRSGQNFVEWSETATVNGSKTFTFGQTNSDWGTTMTDYGKYSVPRSLTIGGATYTFCGYNMTVASRYVIGVKKDDRSEIFAVNMQFDNNGKNSWIDSPLRAWMNNGDSVNFSSCYFYLENCNDVSDSVGTANDFTVLTQRFSANMMNAIMPTVNKTWNGWENDSYNENGQTFNYIVDTFWLLGSGQVNCDGSTAKDRLKSNYDTCKFSTVFSGDRDMQYVFGDPTLIRYYMSFSGGQSENQSSWWFRSADRNLSHCIGSVYGDYVYTTYSSYYFLGCLPACSIG